MSTIDPVRLAAGLLALCLAACDGPTPREPTDSEVQRAESLRPKDAALAAKYERSCALCHGVRGGAPLTGFAPAWQPRLAKGPEALLASARNGLNAMPPQGQCSDCSDEELRQLIRFMGERP